MGEASPCGERAWVRTCAEQYRVSLPWANNDCGSHIPVTETFVAQLERATSFLKPCTFSSEAAPEESLPGGFEDSHDTNSVAVTT